MLPKNREPTSPGEFLKDIITELEMTQETLAKKMGVGIQTVNLIINGKRSITADTALRLAKVFDTTPEYWMNAQAAVDLWRARRELQAEGRL